MSELTVDFEGSATRPQTERPCKAAVISRLYFRYLAASKLWYYSTRCYKKGWILPAKILKALNFFFYHALLNYQCEIERDVYLLHNGLGCIVHPHVTIGRGVKLFPHVLLAAESPPGSTSRIVIEDNVMIGAYAIILGNDRGGIRIGRGAIIGAGTIVNRDVLPGERITPTYSKR